MYLFRFGLQLVTVSYLTILLFVFPVVKEISDLLNTGLDDETLKICLQLLEAGVNPEALATVVIELRKEASALMVSNTTIIIHRTGGMMFGISWVIFI